MGAAVCLLALGWSAGCATTDALDVDAPEPTGRDAEACGRLLDALPDTVADQPRRPVEPEAAFAAAWGDPAIVLTCGGPMPSSFDDFATCTEVNGVGWFVTEPVGGTDGDLQMTTIGRAQNVQVDVPADYLPPATAMVDLSAAINATIEEVRSCL